MPVGYDKVAAALYPRACQCDGEHNAATCYIFSRSAGTAARCPARRLRYTEYAMMAMQIKPDDLSAPQVHALLAEHLRNMHELSPPHSVHALDISALRDANVTFWTVWSGDELLGCGALKQLDAFHGEIKSMRTAATHRRKGVAKAMLEHIIGEALKRSYDRLSLETGSMDAFEPAQRLYASFGFTYCRPFAGYRDDPNSLFMTKTL